MFDRVENVSLISWSFNIGSLHVDNCGGNNNFLENEIHIKLALNACFENHIYMYVFAIGQNKNRYVLGYLCWRVFVGLHKRRYSQNHRAVVKIQQSCKSLVEEAWIWRDCLCVRSCVLRTFWDISSNSKSLHHISFLLVKLGFIMPIKLYSIKKLR